MQLLLKLSVCMFKTLLIIIFVRKQYVEFFLRHLEIQTKYSPPPQALLFTPTDFPNISDIKLAITRNVK